MQKKIQKNIQEAKQKQKKIKIWIFFYSETAVLTTLFLLSTTLLLLLYAENAEALKVTAQIISNHNYPVEEHIVHTPDKYILTIYRIPDSPKLQRNKGTKADNNNDDGDNNNKDEEGDENNDPNSNNNSTIFEQHHSTSTLKTSKSSAGKNKPVVFLQHGILSTSDDWILNGPDSSLAYMFADAGYDVWLGNARGNTYSRAHIHYTPHHPDFWNFSWHEIGVYDLASMFDYVLLTTNVTSIHFVAHSQGTTTFFVLMSSLPQYNERVRTVHLLGPVAFMRNHNFMLSKLGGFFLGQPSYLTYILGSMELLPLTYGQKLFCKHICAETSMFKFLCTSLLDFVGGWGTRHLNQTLLPEVCETHPAGASTSQIIHYMQLYMSGSFRQYDHGVKWNKIYYQQETPPSYEISNIKKCVNLYYSENDSMAAVEDVEHLANLLPCAELFRIPFEDWNHYDFLWSINVKEIINNRILEKIKRYELENQNF